ncbi:MAG TPA: MotA/TolQ/ExbB proton channel family protein [Elusimicrobia bacterium]|nr:MotA/TolQ/ExbB proton channel family protein [Elusimicrobiota bacterium]HBT60865.1 MotA/TolQ/ExbB proton channel family protein [Elusimicrobiota bacterium]
MLGEVSVVVLLKESFTLIILSFCSFLSFTFMIERWWTFRRAQASGDVILGHVHKLMQEGKSDAAQQYCHKNPASVSQIIHYGLLHAARPRRDLEELLASKRMEERLKLERYLGVLGTLGNIAPFIGLFGTVVGIIKAFRDLALSGGGGPAVVAKGIAEALVATAAGLLVAIPAVIIYNYFMRKVKAISVEMEVASTRLLVMLGTK